MIKGKLPSCSCCCCIYLVAVITRVNDALVKVRLKYWQHLDSNFWNSVANDSKSTLYSLLCVTSVLSAIWTQWICAVYIYICAACVWMCVRMCVALWQGLMSKSARLHRPVAPLPYKCHLFPASDLHNAKLLSRNGPISGGERQDHSWCTKPLTAPFAGNNCD